ncbi:metallophosphoesterase [Aneurinibacillus migulanus]|uniref:metallophosphoesterase n=1 Tax=Aneurinibacillus migulanus TaxID=47500 RepID=UPI002E242074|nr:metallophosphoesterase [Aneurinibacillus migulanus]
MNREKRMNRRSFIKRLVAGIGGLMLFTGLDAFFIERHLLRRRDIEVPLADMPDVFEGFRIAHFSDVHIGHGFTASDLESLVERINEAKPDMIAFTGDLVDDGMEELAATTEALARLHAPYGKYAVLGNHDVRGKAQPEQIIEAYQKAGFMPLVNQHVTICHEDAGASFTLAGLDDNWRHPDWETTFEKRHGNGLVIALIHEPDLADRAKEYGVSLQLSGHSHGGQVRLPFVGGLLYPPYGCKYPDGLQKVEDSSMLVHTSRGIGTTILPIRFLCPPEWYILTLRKK